MWQENISRNGRALKQNTKCMTLLAYVYSVKFPVAIEIEKQKSINVRSGDSNMSFL